MYYKYNTIYNILGIFSKIREMVEMVKMTSKLAYPINTEMNVVINI